MYVLTLQFDFTKPNGRFSGDAKSSSGPLTTSMNWLKLNPISPQPGFPIPAGFNVETADWQDLGEAGTLLIPSPDPQVIGIYVRQDRDPGTGAALDDNATVELAVSFGRPSRAHQQHASPFTEDGLPTGTVRTTFVLAAITRNSPPPPSPPPRVGWFFPLHKIAIRPNSPNLTHRYEFSVGIVVKDVTNNVTRYYGEDPEMDVGQ